MVYLESFYAILLLACGTLLVVLAALMRTRRRRASFAWSGMSMLALCSLWTFGYAFELLAPTPAGVILWAKVQYLAVATVPALWFVMALQYTGHEKWLTARNRVLLAIVPTLTIVLALTNEHHQLIWIGSGLRPVGPFTALDWKPGAALWASVTTSYALLLVSTILMVQFLFRSHAYYRFQITAILLAAFGPWAASVHDLFRLPPLSPLEVTPLAFALTGTLLSWSLLRSHIVDILPVARGVVLESMNDAVIVLDAQARIVDLNNVAGRWLGASVERAIGERVQEVWPEGVSLIGPPRDEIVWKEIELRSQAQRRDLDMRISPLKDRRGRLAGRVIVLRDITVRKRTERGLRESEERYALSAEGANDGLWDWDLRRHTVYFSPRWKSMLGYAEEEISDSPEEWFRLAHPEDKDQLRAEIQAHLEGRTPHLEFEYRILHKDGTYRWMLCRSLAVRDSRGIPYRMAGSQTDITDRKTVEHQLTYDAFHDSLTRLPNRNFLLHRLESAVERLNRRPDYHFAVLFLDLDRFKVVNDSLGHMAGDELLVAVARRLQACMRQDDVVARLGGDEFVVLLDNLRDSADAMRTADRIQQQLRSPFVLDGRRIFTTVSIGIALSGTGYLHPQDILRDADTAMYRAKLAGKARYELFNPSMHALAMEQLRLEVDLRRALEEREFRVHYQPIYYLPERKLLGLEALLRWQHPLRGLLFPGDFLAVAEETGLIVPIGAWVLREACLQLRAWQDKRPDSSELAITVNLSMRQLFQPDLVDQVRFTLAETGVPARCLRLEVTENAMMEDPVAAGERLRELRALGVQIYLDDFGTGYSSLSILHEFSVDVLKIDHAFVSRLNAESRNAEIVRTIVALAESLNIEVIAEGVETEDQLAQLQLLRCTYGQGRLLAAPESAERTLERLAAHYPEPNVVRTRNGRRLRA